MCDFTDIDECKQSPCKNGGTCTNKPGGYSCVCAAGFEGDNCDGGLENTHVTSMALPFLSFIAAISCIYPLSLLYSLFILYRCYITFSPVSDVDECKNSPCQHGGNLTSTEAINARVRLVSTETTAKTVRGRLIDISDIVLCSDEGQLLLVEFGDSQEYWQTCTLSAVAFSILLYTFFV